MSSVGSVIENFVRDNSSVSAITGKRVLAALTGIDVTQLKDVLETANTQPSLCYIPIHAESITKRRQIDVSNTMLISQVTQAKTYVTDNSAPHPRTWNIRGYIKALAPMVENWLLIKPTLVVQEEVLDAASESRQTVKLKTDTGEVVDVLITNLSIGSTPKGQNVRTVDVTVQEVTVLQNSTADSLGLDSVGSASIPVKVIKNFGSNYAIHSGIASSASLLMSINIPLSSPNAGTTTGKEDKEENQVSKPTFSVTDSKVDKNTRVTIDCGTSGATIIYTTDGSIPDIGGTKYINALTISSDVTVKARAFKSGMKHSGVAYARYVVKEGSEIPTLNDISITNNAGTVSITSTDEDVDLLYTMDGSTPDFDSNVYVNPFIPNKSMQIKAMAVKNGYNNSKVAVLNYTK